jgi:hypothetical protein
MGMFESQFDGFVAWVKRNSHVLLAASLLTLAVNMYHYIDLLQLVADFFTYLVIMLGLAWVVRSVKRGLRWLIGRETRKVSREEGDYEG